MPRGRAKTRTATAADAAAYLAKGREFLRAAQDALALGNRTAASGNAVHAGISASDAVAAALVGAVSLTLAANRLHASIAASPSLQKALAAFDGLAATAPSGQRQSLERAIAAVNSGPLGANAVPATTAAGGRTVPVNPQQGAAYHALSHGFSVGYVLCAVAAFVAAGVVVTLMRSPRGPVGR